MIRYILLSISLCLLLPVGVGLAQSVDKDSDSNNFNTFAQTIFVGNGSFLGVFTEDSDRGVTVTRVVKDSPADKAGIKKDDVISTFDNEQIASVNKLNRLINEAAPGQVISLVVLRDGSKQNISLKLGKRNDFPQVFTTRIDSDDLRRRIEESQERANEARDRAQERSGEARERLQERADEARRQIDELRAQGRLFSNDGQTFTFSYSSSRRIGVTTTELSEQLAEFFGVKDKHGVLVQTVSENSPASKAGIKAGDVIIDVDGEKVEQVGDLSRAIGRKEEGEVKVTLVRNKSQMTVNVTPEKRPASGSNTFFRFDTPDAFTSFPAITIPDIEFDPIVLPLISIPSVRMPEIRVGPVVTRGINYSFRPVIMPRLKPIVVRPRVVVPMRSVGVPMSPVVSF